MLMDSAIGWVLWKQTVRQSVGWKLCARDQQLGNKGEDWTGEKRNYDADLTSFSQVILAGSSGVRSASRGYLALVPNGQVFKPHLAQHMKHILPQKYMTSGEASPSTEIDPEKPRGGKCLSTSGKQVLPRRGSELWVSMSSTIYSLANWIFVSMYIQEVAPPEFGWAYLPEEKLRTGWLVGKTYSLVVLGCT